MGDVLDAILQREGGLVHDPQDHGGRTQFGIAERDNPEAWKDGQVTAEEARAIYIAKYVHGPGFDQIADTPLRNQLIDFGVNSGPMVAILRLQRILRVPEDGVLGPQTLAALAQVHPEEVHHALLKARILLIGTIVQTHPDQLKFLLGWLSRALEFL